MEDTRLYEQSWGGEYAKFFSRNIGNPSAPITVPIFRSCIAPFLALEAVNAIGLHTLQQSPHLPQLSDCESAICTFVARVMRSRQTQSWAGFVCAGATLANIQAVYLARECAERMGLRFIVCSSDSAHYSLTKALKVNSIPQTSLLRPEDLHCLKDPGSCYLLIWLTYGDTHYGVFETPDGIVVGGLGGVFRHLDAAYGGLLTPMRSLPDPRIDLVDTCVVDFHKTGRLPCTRSFFMLRRDLLADHPFCAAYIPHGKDFTLQGSRPFSHTMQMHSYVTTVGYERHAAWADQVEEFAKEIASAFDDCPYVSGLTRSANILLFKLARLGDQVLHLLESYNVSGDSTDYDADTVWRVFAWPELGRRPYTEFLESLSG